MEIKSPIYTPRKAHRDKKKNAGRFNQDIKHNFKIQECGSCGRKPPWCQWTTQRTVWIIINMVLNLIQMLIIMLKREATWWKSSFGSKS